MKIIWRIIRTTREKCTGNHIFSHSKVGVALFGESDDYRTRRRYLNREVFNIGSVSTRNTIIYRVKRNPDRCAMVLLYM